MQERGQTLRHACRCSFLQIYSENITDLLTSSDAVLPLREDLKGPYVDGLSQQPVHCGMCPDRAVIMTCDAWSCNLQWSTWPALWQQGRRAPARTRHLTAHVAG